MKRAVATCIAAAALLAAAAGGYPLDATDETGITRLDAYWLAREGLIEQGVVPPGAFKPMAAVKLRLLERPDFQIPAPDPVVGAALESFLGGDARDYGVAVLDLTDLEHPRYAEVNGDKPQNPGSVGKIMVLLAWFQELADLYPYDIAARHRLLKDSVITADDFIVKDTHKVPFWKHGDPTVVRRPIEIGDRANLWTYFDWAASASSNAAASMLLRHLILLRRFGAEYPVSEAEASAFFERTPKTELGQIFLDSMRGAAQRNGIDWDRLRQGSFFTRTGKERVPGTNSVATARELMRYMVLMEQGRLVDPWSSLQIKRLLYLTDIRIRYAAQPALDDSAVYYKSGSLYSCKPEKGFVCEKYHGNRLNYLNSIAAVETDRPGGDSLYYLVAVMSNVLRKNSSEEHEMLALRIHRWIESLHPAGGRGATPETAEATNASP